MKYTNVSLVWLNGNKQETKPYGRTEKTVILMETMSRMTGLISIIVYNIPNCPILYKNDPRKEHRCEDGMVAYGWFNAISDPNNGELLPFFPMAKGAFQAMRGAKDFLNQ